MSALDILAAILTVEVALLLPAAAYVTGVYLTSRHLARDRRVPALYSIIVACVFAIAAGGGIIAVILLAHFARTPVRDGAFWLGVALIPLLFTPIAVAFAIWRIRRSEDEE